MIKIVVAFSLIQMLLLDEILSYMVYDRQNIDFLLHYRFLEQPIMPVICLAHIIKEKY